jgi:hypothetical protein
MTRCIQALRFVTGLAMLVGGVAVLAPRVADLLAERSSAPENEGEAPSRAMSPSVIGHAIPDPRSGMRVVSEPPPWSDQTDDGNRPQSPSAPAVSAYHPPSPPPRLPAEPTVTPRPAPPLGTTYRSTLAIPPPPLLDAHGPPPLAPGWTTRGPRRPVSESPAPTPSVPTAYVVRDGDDLTSLAIRFYGHPAAAAAIHAANRDRIVDPDILSIGATLRLPPPWTITAGRDPADQRTIEPGPGIGRGPATMGPAAAVTPAPHPWLGHPAHPGQS